MKKIYPVFGLATLLFLSFLIPSASATTGIISNDPQHAMEFSFYCGPYVKSFEMGKHYMPNNTTCVYSIPSTISGSKIVSLYKGSPGVAATQVGGDLVAHGGTLITQTPNFFGGAQNGDDFFAVIYDFALDQTATPLNAYLQGATSTLPSGVVENQNFYIIPWKWGPKPVEEFDPVVIITETLSTWQTDEGVVIDPLFNTYRNLIDTLVANGYVEGQTLFTLPYNWENSGMQVATLIQNTIDTIQSTCNCEQVDVLAHGTAGMTAAQYITGGSYGGDIDQLLMVGTPWNGIPAAYAAWEAGLIQFDEPLRNGVAQALLNHKAAVGGYTSTFAYVQNAPVTSFLEMLPVTSYLSGKTYPTGYPTNSFLSTIHAAFSNLSSGAQLHLFDSNSSVANTPNSFTIIASPELPLWPHGKPIGTQLAKGDSMVTFLSAEYFLSADVPLNNVKHQDLPTATQSQVFAAMNGAAPTTVVNNSYPTSCVLFLTVSQGTDIQLTDPNGLKLGKNFTGSGNFAEIGRSLYSGPNAAAEYLAVANPIQGTYQVRTQGNVNGSFTITATDVCNNGTNTASTTSTTAPGQVLGYSVTVGSSNTVAIESLDNTAPMVTITSPVQGATYFDTASVLFTATISDASPIAASVYSFNGVVVAANDPLPLLTAPLGLTTVSVSATDVFGNAASTTATFTIKSSDVAPPTITITNPIAGQTYPNTASVVPAANITDTSGVATSTFYFNGNEIDRTLPLPLSTTGAGSATLTVSATDIYGNATSTNVMFTVTAPPASDTQGPVITIIRPEQGKVYARSEKIYVQATFTDQSPIVSKKYYLNGKKIDPAKPLYFKTAPLGTSTLVVKAKDSFGNLGAATSTFRVIPGNGSCLADIIEAFDHKWVKDKKIFTKLFSNCKIFEKIWWDRDHGHNYDHDEWDRVWKDFERDINRSDDEDRKNGWGQWNDGDDD